MADPQRKPPPTTDPAPLEAFWIRLAAHGARIRRSYPRVHASVPVHLRADGGTPVDLTTRDVSLGGFQVRCDRATAERLRPARDADGKRCAIPFCMKLSVTGMPHKLVGKGRVTHLSLVPDAHPDEEVAVGVEYAGFEAGSQDVLRRYVEQHLLPKEL